MLLLGMPTQIFFQLDLLNYSFTISNVSEVFVIVSLTLFLPICLEQFARDNGYVAPDRTRPCSLMKPISLPANGTSVSTRAEALVDAERCEVKILWAWIDTASFRCDNSFASPITMLINFFSVFMSTQYP